MVDTDKDTLNEDERLELLKIGLVLEKGNIIVWKRSNYLWIYALCHCSMTSESGDSDAVSPFNKLLNNYEIHNVMCQNLLN